jgi:hypothetical protein
MPGNACPRVNGCGSKTLMDGPKERKNAAMSDMADQQNPYFHRQFVVSIGVLE